MVVTVTINKHCAAPACMCVYAIASPHRHNTQHNDHSLSSLGCPQHTTPHITTLEEHDKRRCRVSRSKLISLCVRAGLCVFFGMYVGMRMWTVPDVGRTNVRRVWTYIRHMYGSVAISFVGHARSGSRRVARVALLFLQICPAPVAGSARSTWLLTRCACGPAGVVTDLL